MLYMLYPFGGLKFVAGGQKYSVVLLLFGLGFGN